MNYFDSNSCGHSFHCFQRDAAGNIQAYHADADSSLCEGAELDFADMLQGVVESVDETVPGVSITSSEAFRKKASH